MKQFLKNTKTLLSVLLKASGVLSLLLLIMKLSHLKYKVVNLQSSLQSDTIFDGWLHGPETEFNYEFWIKFFEDGEFFIEKTMKNLYVIYHNDTELVTNFKNLIEAMSHCEMWRE